MNTATQKASLFRAIALFTKRRLHHQKVFYLTWQALLLAFRAANHGTWNVSLQKVFRISALCRGYLNSDGKSRKRTENEKCLPNKYKSFNPGI